MKTQIITNLTAYVTAQILKQPEKNLGAHEKIISTGLIDSFHLVDISLFIEDQYGVLIDDTELNAATFDTIDELAELVNQRKS